MELLSNHKQSVQFDLVQGEGPLKELESLLSRSFKVPEGASFYDDFPVWDAHYGAKVFRVGAYSQGKLVSSASIRLASLKTPTCPIPVAILGSVVTEEGWKGRGLASQSVSLVMTWAREQGAVMALLWGSEYELYHRQGFELCGMQVRVPLNTLVECRLSAGDSIAKGWKPEILSAMEKRPEGLAIGYMDRKWMPAHKNVAWWSLERDGKLQAFAGMGRGIDLPKMVHEWGGNPDDLKKILSVIRAEVPDAELIGSPFVLDRNAIAYPPSAMEYLCMAKVLNGEQLFLGFHPDKPYNLGSLSDQEVALILLGPSATEPAIPLWLWGLDGA